MERAGAAPVQARRSLVVVGLVREWDGAAALVREEPVRLELRVYPGGSWIVCGGGTCDGMDGDDPRRWERVFACLLGSSFG